MSKIEDNAVELVRSLAPKEQFESEGMRLTGQRLYHALREMTAGYNDDPAVILGTDITSLRFRALSPTAILLHLPRRRAAAWSVDSPGARRRLQP